MNLKKGQARKEFIAQSEFIKEKLRTYGNIKFVYDELIENSLISMSYESFRRICHQYFDVRSILLPIKKNKETNSHDLAKDSTKKLNYNIPQDKKSFQHNPSITDDVRDMLRMVDDKD